MKLHSTMNWLEIVLLLLPLVVGTVVLLIQNAALNAFTEKIERWFRQVKVKFAEKKGYFSRFALKPLISLIVKFFDWTDSMANLGLKNGIRLASILYIVEIWIFLLYIAFIVILSIVIGIAVMIFIFKLVTGTLGESSPDSIPSSDRAYRKSSFDESVINSVGIRGEKVYEGTSWFNEKMKGRVDNNGIIYQGTNWLSEERIGRIADDGTIYRGTNGLNEVKVGRIDENGTVFKGKTWLAEEKEGRIDKDGNIFAGSSWFNEKKIGKSSE